MLTFAIAASLASALPTASATATFSVPDTDPAMWVVRDEDTTIYLFGTFHALDGRSNWLNGEVRSAFYQSDEVILETLLPEAAPGLPRRHARRAAAEPIRPGASFLASTRVALSAGRLKGLKFDHGADAVLRNAARHLGKKVGGLETYEFQMNMFSRLRAEGSPFPARRSADPIGDLATVMATMQASWNRGEGEVFAGMLEEMRRRSPNTYRTLFLERNAHWAEWISGRLDRPGTVFVAVGAGHLAGSDSVQNKLAMLGVRSARLN
ncbi:MAG: TraB/GumN family protein [Pseudomonadota bacterium]|nr:TraB/GumN family protein [Pseudomonadota bacterium]